MKELVNCPQRHLRLGQHLTPTLSLSIRVKTDTQINANSASQIMPKCAKKAHTAQTYSCLLLNMPNKLNLQISLIASQAPDLIHLV